MPKLFVWDFHGVLEKDNEYSVQELMRLVMEHFGLKGNLDIEEIRTLYGKRWFDYMKHFAPSISDDIARQMVEKVLELQNEKDTVKKFIKPRDNVADVLERIRGRGHKNIVISNTDQQRVKYFLDAVGLTALIDDYFGVDNHRNGFKNMTKEAVIRNAAEGFDKAIVVGDSEEDIKAGKATGATTYLFINECNVNRKFTTEPHHVINDLREVLDEL